jgi:hypothetical protein
METPIPRSRGVDNLAALDRECNRGLGIPRSWGVDDLAALDRECNRDSDSEEEISNFANAENSPEGTDKNTN